MLGERIGLGVDVARLAMSGDDLGVSFGGRGGMTGSTERRAGDSSAIAGRVSAKASCTSEEASAKTSSSFLDDTSLSASSTDTVANAGVESGDGSGSTGAFGVSFLVLGLILRSSDKSTDRPGDSGIDIEMEASVDREG